MFETLRDAEPVCATIGLEDIAAVRVDHCHDAWGFVLTSGAGWRLVFSGDTRPSRRLCQAGAGATLLIHEATFEPAMHAQARRLLTAKLTDCGAQLHARSEPSCTAAGRNLWSSRSPASSITSLATHARYTCMIDMECGGALQAVSKRHSTTEEALQVAASMGAYRTILTHFSQRYPKIPVGIPTSGVALDFLDPA